MVNLGVSETEGYVGGLYWNTLDYSGDVILASVETWVWQNGK